MPSPPWKNVAGGFRKRVYEGYEDYKKHQVAKLIHLEGGNWLTEYERKFEPVLRERLLRDGVVEQGNSVLCLAARRGAEVRAFLSLGCFAIGVDLNPGNNNDFVLHGDFHKLVFASESVDHIYCNALDHAFDLQAVIDEVARLIKPAGHVIIEMMKGSSEGKPQVDAYDCLHWETIDNVIDLFEPFGFSIIRRFEFVFPWDGEHICMVKDNAGCT